MLPIKAGARIEFHSRKATDDKLTCHMCVHRNSTDKRTLIENYDLVSLAIDEICDDGIILEVDPVIVASRVSRPPPQDVQLKGVDFSEQGVYNLLEIGKNKLAERMRQL